MKKVLAQKVLALGGVLFAGLASAQQGYPSKPIRVILPVPVSAGVDIILRRAGEDLRTRLNGQGFVIDNRASANMVTGADACAKAAPDGYNICGLSALSVALNPFIMSNLPYDAEKDFVPVFNMFVLKGGLMAKAALPVANAKDLEAYVKSRPGQINFGVLGIGSTTDVSRLWLEQHWKTKIVPIPYKGAPNIITGLVSGEIDIAFIGAYNALGPIKAGKIRLLGVDGTKRTPVFPDVPVLSELNLEGLPTGRPWWGIFVPAKTPDAVVRRLNTELNRLFAEPSFVEFLDTQIVEIVAGSPEKFADMIREERANFSQIVRKYNIPKE
jgi:tripartite-type tricarboxylate transporter receptor subunit TctC